MRSIKDLAKLKNLLELDAEENLIEDIGEVASFKDCRSLEVLNVKENSVCR